MLTAALLAAALLLGLVAARFRTALFTLLAAGAVVVSAGALLFAGSLPIAAVALLLGAISCGAVVLPRALPRLFVFLVLFAAAPVAVGTLPAPAPVVLAVVLLLGAIAAAWKAPDAGLRLASASIGARLLVQAVFHQWRWGWWAAGLAALLAADALLRAGLWPERRPTETLIPPGIPGLLPGALLGLAVAVAGLLLPSLVPVLPPPPAAVTSGSAPPSAALAESAPTPGAPAAPPAAPPPLPPLPFAERRARLAKEAPAGGLIWSLPSEAILWDEELDRALFPRFDNLDALHLGAPARGAWRLPGTGLLGRFSLHGPISQQRLFPDAAALARLRAAALATTAALRDLLPEIKAGLREADLGRALVQAMAARGCGRESFPLVIASGPSAAEPHGSGNKGTLEAGTLLVADMGCYWDHYASDYTRTLPIGGHFTPRQRQLYDAVYAAQAAAIAACKPGVKMSGAQRGQGKSLAELARAVLRERAPDHLDHMDHGLGHTVGLFVHDVIDSGPLREGMVVTIEPGTYLKGELGIRIEDTFLVTKDGCERITEGFPAEAEKVEAAMGAGK